MTKIQRTTQKIFGSNAPADDIAALGSFKTGTPIYTDNIATLQNETFEEGYSAALVANEAPFMEEQNSIPYVLSKQLAYNFQEGIPEYDTGTTYYIGSIIKTLDNDNTPVLYYSLIDNNTNNPLTDGTKWQKVELGGGGLEVGDIGTALYIDETKGKRRRLNGSILAINANTQGFLSYLKKLQPISPSLFTTEENWQAELTLSDKGQIGKFVIDEEAGTIRLPKVVNIQGLQDLAQAGMRVEAGLPNITGTASAEEWNSGISGSKTGCIYPISTWGNDAAGGGNQKNRGFGIDASRSSAVYGRSNTVQEEAIQYPFYIQIATGAETEVDIINKIELNNPFTLLESKYTNEPLYNLSWLLADGEFKPKGSYSKVYEALQVEYNPEIAAGEKVELLSGTTYVKRGLSVKLSTETYTDRDFVINITDETFLLATNLNNNETNLGLYYYVGETVQNANLIDAGRFQEQLALKPNISQVMDCVQPSYENAASRPKGTYTETVNGILIACPTTDNGSSYWGVTIQDKHYRFHQGYSGTDYAHNTNGYFSIPKGVKYELNIIYDTVVYFVPLKGEIK